MTGATATESSRDQIIRAAAESLLESGYSGTSVRSIASKAGVAIGNLQYWFPTKSELLVEAWRYLTATSVEELRRTLNQLTDPLEVLEVGVESLWDSLRRLGDVQLAAFDLLVQAPRTERLRESELDRLAGLCSDALAERYESSLDVVIHFDPEVQPKLALAAALIESGVRLQGLGGRAAPPTTLLTGDLCLARGSRLLA